MKSSRVPGRESLVHIGITQGWDKSKPQMRGVFSALSALGDCAELGLSPTSLSNYLKDVRLLKEMSLVSS